MATAAPPAAGQAPAAPQAPGPVSISQIRPIPRTSQKPTHKGLGMRPIGKGPDLPGVMDTLPEESPETGIQATPEAGEPNAGVQTPEQLAADQTGEQPSQDPAPWLDLDLGDGQVAKFRDQEHLTQNLKTLRGQFRSMQQNEVSANEKAYGWHQAATRYEGMLRALGVDPETGAFGGPSGAQPGSPSTTQPAQQATGGDLSVPDVEREFQEAIDYKIVNQLLQRNPMEALAYIQMENAKTTAKLIAEKLPALVDSRLAPLQEHAERSQGMSRVSQFWSQARAAQNQDGSPMFPELQTEQGQNDLAKIWVSLRSEHGMPLEFLMTPQGLHTAALWYRSYMASQGATAPAQAAPQATVAQTVAAQTRAAVNAQANRGQVISGGRASTPAPNARPADPKKALAQAIRNAGPSSDLGVVFDN